MRALIACLMTIAAFSPSLAQEPTTGMWVLEGCQDAVRGSDTRALSFKRGVCHGVVDAINHVAPLFPDKFKSCAPREATSAETVRVVTIWLEQNPARLHEAFAALAAEALREAWPCRRA